MADSLNLSGRIQALRKSTEQRNFIVGVFNGAFTQLGMNLSHPSLVLSVFIRALGGSNTLIGLLPAIRFGGWFLPQFFVASWIQPQQRKVPIAVGLETFRAVTYALLGVLCYALGPSHPQLLLILFFVLFSSTRLTAGTGALARTDAIGKVISPRRRAPFFALRNFIGGILIFGAGFFIRYVLDEDHGQPFPLNFTLFFVLSAFFFLLALLFFSRVKEQPGPADSPHRSLKEQISRGPGLFRGNPAFRRYIWVRLLQNMVRLASPFYPVFALDILNAPESMVGFYLSAMTLARIFSNPLWQWIGRRRGNIFLTKIAALLTALEPILAVALPWGLRLAGLTVENNGLLPAYLFTLVFLISGSSMSGRSIGFMALMLDLSPEDERASYIGFLNTLLGVSTLLTVLAGAVIDWIGFAPIFWASAVLLVLGYLATLGWKDEAKSPIIERDPVMEELVRPDRM